MFWNLLIVSKFEDFILLAFPVSPFSKKKGEESKTVGKFGHPDTRHVICFSLFRRALPG